MEAKIKVKADLENVLGKKLAASLLAAVKNGNLKRLPSSVTITNVKPSFHLSDGDTLHAYGADLAANAITGQVYCGSGDTTMHHAAQQLGEGQSAPDGKALIMVHSYWNGRNHSWAVTVVSNNFVPQLDTRKA